MIPIIKKRSALILHRHADSLSKEEYETMRLNIEFLAYENSCKSILFTSPSEKEGKSTTLANLGISLAQGGYKVLIIDAHIRKPVIHQYFRIRNSYGLTNILAGQRNFEEAINQTEVKNLYILTSGPIPFNTEKLFRSHAMDKLMNEDILDFDYVLLDSPPVLEGVDAKVLSSKCDGTILIIRNGKTEDTLAIEAKKSLEIAKGKIIGVVFNGKGRKFSLRRKNTFNM